MKYARGILRKLRRSEPRRQYRYGDSVLLGERTDFFLFLRAMAAGYVYYDPGIKLERASTPRPVSKRRSQFRIKLSEVPRLYSSSERVTL